MKNIYELNLNETIETDDEDIKIIRVPGGWLYIIKEKQPIFISMSNDLEKVKNNLDAKTVIKTIESYYKLPIPISTDHTIREGNYPIAKQMICHILTEYAAIDNILIAKMLKYKNRSSVSNSRIAFAGYLQTSKKTRNQYNDVKILLKIF